MSEDNYLLSLNSIYSIITIYTLSFYSISTSLQLIILFFSTIVIVYSFFSPLSPNIIHDSMNYQDILTTIGTNIINDLYDNFVLNYPLLLIINPNNYSPVFTTNVINNDSLHFGLVGLLVLFVGDVAYAFVRLILALVVLSVYFGIFTFLVIWLVVTVRRRWKVLGLYVRSNDVLVGVT